MKAVCKEYLEKQFGDESVVADIYDEYARSAREKAEEAAAALNEERYAVVSTSPFFIPPDRISAKVFSLTRTLPAATAVRSEIGFSPTSTIFARPCSLKCVKSSIFCSV